MNYKDMKTVEQYPKCPWCLRRIKERLRKVKNICPYCEQSFSVTRKDVVHIKSYYDTEPIGGQRYGVKHLASSGMNYKWHTFCGFSDIEPGDLDGDGFENWTTDTEKATCKGCLDVVLKEEEKKTMKAKKRLDELKRKKKDGDDMPKSKPG